MRCARVPPPLALGLLLHGVVYLTNHDAAALDAATATPAASSPPSLRDDAVPPTPILASRRLRFEHLPAPLLASALQRCRAFIPEGTSYTIASSGDASKLVVGRGSFPVGGGEQGTDDREAKLDNVVLLHIVQRQHSDFIPNNRIYHAMQRRYYLHRQDVEPTAAAMVSPALTGTAAALAEGERACPDDDGSGASSPASPAISARASPFSTWFRSLQRTGDRCDAGTSGGSSQCSSEPPPPPHVPATPLVLPEHLVAEAVRSARESENLSVWLQPPSPLAAAAAASNTGSSMFHFYPYTNNVDTSVAYTSKWFVVLVNLKPVVPGHLLIVPKRIVHGIHAMHDEEVAEWGVVLRKTIDVLRVAHCNEDLTAEDEGFSIAIQHGRESGQTVWHQHTHVMPFTSSSRLAGEPEEGDEAAHAQVPPRTPQAMRKEAMALRLLFYPTATA